MKIKYQKYEMKITIFLIILYLLVNSYCMNNYGIISYQNLICNLIISISILIFIIKNKLTYYYGLKKVKDIKKYLYFIPLLILILANLINGINISNNYNEIIIYVLVMINIGFLEEIIFRGFLFNSLKKDNINLAIIVSSLTFGVGHIMNIFFGAEIISTLIQMCYATSVGYLFVIIFHKSKSLLPCIITHMLVNTTSIFANESNYNIPLLLTIIPIFYSLYIVNKIK